MEPFKMKLVSVVILAAFLLTLVEAEEYEDYEALYENATKIEATNDTDIEIDNNIESINETTTNTYTSVDNSTDSQDLLNLIAELEREAALKNIQSFEDYKRTTFGSVQLGVEKYECYARLLGKIAKKYDEQETLDAIAEELRQLFWRWRDCQDENCQRTQWEDVEDRLNSFFYLIGSENAAAEYHQEIENRC